MDKIRYSTQKYRFKGNNFDTSYIISYIHSHQNVSICHQTFLRLRQSKSEQKVMEKLYNQVTLSTNIKPLSSNKVCIKNIDQISYATVFRSSPQVSHCIVYLNRGEMQAVCFYFKSQAAAACSTDGFKNCFQDFLGVAKSNSNIKH